MKKSKLLWIVICFLVCVKGHAYSEGDLFPFDKRHLTYPNFQSDLEQISKFIGSICTYDENKLAPDVKDDILRTCTFPKLLEMINEQTQTANHLFETRELVTRDKAQFIDLEYGWVFHDPTSLSATAHIPLLNVLLLRLAMQKTMASTERMWLVQGKRESITGRFYILPEFAAGLERDLILARSIQYARTILCIDDSLMGVEGECIEHRTSLAIGLNTFLSEFQTKNLNVPPEILDYYNSSQAFRAKLGVWVKTHSDPRQVVAAINSPDESYKDLADTYAALIDAPKRIQAADINAMVASLNVHRYVNELQKINIGHSDYLKNHQVSTTPEIMGILTQIRRQLDLYYKDTTNH
jgi:hypothetical protein